MPFGNETNTKSVRREWDVCQLEGDVSLHKVELLYLLVRLDVLESKVSRQVDDLEEEELHYKYCYNTVGGYIYISYHICIG